MEPTSTRRNRHYTGASYNFVMFQTRVPSWVREHHRQVAEEMGISLSRYVEKLAMVDLRHVLEEEEPEPQAKAPRNT